MKKKGLILLLCCLLPNITMVAQNSEFDELPNPAETDMALWQKTKKCTATWGSTDVRYKQEAPATERIRTLQIDAWKGETVNAQIVISAKEETKVSLLPIALNMGKKARIVPENVDIYAVKYVMTDELNKDGKGGCGHRKKEDFDSSLVADFLDPMKAGDVLKIDSHHTRPVWLSIHVPADAQSGAYCGTIVIQDAENKPIERLKLRIDVSHRTLPAPKEWKFHLDLWQNPYAVSRFYKVEPFSDEHFELIRPIMKRYAEAGGKVITTSIIYRPWNGQTEDAFDSMIEWRRKKNGEWAFDYTIFDRWVEFMMGMGVTEQITCYSMIPWKLSFRFYNEATKKYSYLKAEPGSKAFEIFWKRMLIDFAAHLKSKGWFDRTYIGIDERKMEHVIATLEVIRSADPLFKVAYAGHFHKQLAYELDDYCVAYGREFPDSVREQRKRYGMKSTYYTCCSEPLPNSFTFSPPAESAFLGLYAAAQNYDGYLRWALNSWTKNPCLDSRFRTWAAGDCYQLYPSRPGTSSSSIRYEKIRQGVQDYEKVRLLRMWLKEENNQKGLQKLNDLLKPFDNDQILLHPAADIVNTARKELNKL